MHKLRNESRFMQLEKEKSLLGFKNLNFNFSDTPGPINNHFFECNKQNRLFSIFRCVLRQ